MREREDMEGLSLRILRESCAELFLAFRFLAPALGAMPFVFDTSTLRVGTDSESFFYNPRFLMETYLRHPYMVNRAYLHVILHCLFRHMHSAMEHIENEANHKLWDLSCDIAAEHVLDGLDANAVRRVPDELREGWYTRLEKEVKILTAERLFHFFQELRSSGGLPNELLTKLMKEFTVDDHSFWYRDKKKQNAPEQQQTLTPEEIRQNEDQWKQRARQVKESIDANGKKGSSAAGALDQMLGFSVRRRRTYHELLRHFTVEREECRIDPDSFDYGYYYFGMERYGNMPLIEENEYMESRKIQDFVIAIDTSASCSDGLIAQFLNETADVLMDENMYFRKARIHILQCDTQVRSDTLLTSAEEMKTYADGFHIQGGGGTDFRPVFEYVKTLDLEALRGLIFFTDGLGTYPKTPTPYETAFVFARDDLICEKDIPPWIIPIFLPEEV